MEEDVTETKFPYNYHYMNHNLVKLFAILLKVKITDLDQINIFFPTLKEKV